MDLKVFISVKEHSLLIHQVFNSIRAAVDSFFKILNNKTIYPYAPTRLSLFVPMFPSCLSMNEPTNQFLSLSIDLLSFRRNASLLPVHPAVEFYASLFSINLYIHSTADLAVRRYVYLFI